VGGTTKDVTRWRAVIGGVIVVLGASAAAWALAFPQAAPAATVVRALADCAAVVTLGLAVVPMLDTGRYRDELTRRAAGPVTWAAGFWLFAELCRLVVGAAAAAGVPVTRVGLTTTAEFAYATSAGRSGLFSAAAAGLVMIVALVAAKTPPAAVAAAGITAVGLVARTIGGHMSASTFGGIAIAIHVLAAAAWCGTLAALVLTIDHRGQWARVLPRFSELSLLSVIALLASGLTGALAVLDSPSQLFTTGYGRLLLAKIVLTVVLMTLAWHNRARWLPAAKSHRVTAYVSRSRSLTELAIMAVALTMAAALSVTG
jgi:putative copper resistance protein D